MRTGKEVSRDASPDVRPDLLVVAGEHSGDAHAAQWVGRLLKADPGLGVYAFGGPALKDSGATLLLDTTPFSGVGLR
jgi:lipid-A-disaccharide synthase